MCPEAALNDGQLDPGLEQPGGIAMAQRMDAARLLDAGLFLGQVVHVRRTVAAQRSARDGAREQPMGRAHAAPVGAQLLQQPGREWHVAVLASLALLDPQEHAPGIDVGHAQARQFAAPKPGAVGGHQQGTVLGVGRHREQPQQFVMIEDLGQGGGCLGAGQIEVRLG